MKDDGNIIKNAFESQMRHEIESGHAKEVYNECRRNMYRLHAVNYMMIIEAQKAFDLIEDKGLCRHKMKHIVRLCEAEWDKYQKTLKMMYEPEAYAFITDFCIKAHANMEKHFTYMRIAIHNVFLKSKTENAEINAQILTVICIGDILSSMWEHYFKQFKNMCGIDFQGCFKFANLSPTRKHLKDMFDITHRCIDCADVTNDKGFVNAFNSIENALISKSYLEDAAKSAISYSPTYTQVYEKQIKEIEDESNADTLALLATKYKVGRL